jgi:glycosidase
MTVMRVLKLTKRISSRRLPKQLKRSSGIGVLGLVLALTLVSYRSTAQQPARDVSREPARATRDWVRDGVIYEIYPRAFSPQGDFNGITARLDALKELGVNMLWLMPIHPIGQEKKKGTIGSPYAVRDYYGINPDYGTKDDLKKLIAGAHRRGMKVIIDIVANHTSWDSVMMKTPEFYEHDAQGRITYPHDWSDVAELNYNNPRLRRYMIDMLKYWIREFDLDGFRCDVAEEVPTEFWETARAELDQLKPDIVMLAEGHKAELLLKAFDFDYSWPLHAALTNVLQGREPAGVLRSEWEKEAREWPVGALHMRFSDNHDERRALARFGEPAALAASALMFTLDGVPLIYNGMEVGDTTESGAPALFEKLPVFWPIAERRPEFPRFYKQMGALRRASDALRRGSLEWLRNSDEARVVTYLRRTATEEVLVAINLSSQPFFGSVEVAGDGFSDVTPEVGPPLPPDAPAPAQAARKHTVGLPSVALAAWGYRIYRRASK